MPILLKRRNGEITPFQNAEFIPAFYFIPKAILMQCGAELNSIPRNPRELLHSRDAVAMVESELFRLLIIDAYAFMVWPFMGLGAKREIYSGNEPSWIYAHAAPLWINELQDEKIIPTAQDLLKDGGVDERFGYVSEEEISALFQWLVPQTMAHHRMNEIIDAAKEYRCFEDFDFRSSNQKTDFYRKWYHTRSKHPQISLESFQESYGESHSGQEWDIPDTSSDMENDVAAEIEVERFLRTLSETERKILEMRMDGFTLEEIAGRLGYQTHSAVLKRIRKVGQQYEKFADVDYGFCSSKIL